MVQESKGRAINQTDLIGNIAQPTQFRLIYDAACTQKNLVRLADLDNWSETELTDLQTLTLRLCYLSMDIYSDI